MKANKLATVFIRGTKEVLTKGENLWSSTATVFFSSCEFSSPDEIKKFLDDADASVLEWIETLPEESGKKVRQSWKTSYLGVFRACQKMRTSGKADNLSAFIAEGKPLSIHKCREILGTGTKAKTTKATTATTATTTTPKGNKGGVNPPSNPPIIKAQTVKTTGDLYDAVLPAFEMVRAVLIEFSKGNKKKLTASQADALTDLTFLVSKGLESLADLIE